MLEENFEIQKILSVKNMFKHKNIQSTRSIGKLGNDKKKLILQKNFWYERSVLH